MKPKLIQAKNEILSDTENDIDDIKDLFSFSYKDSEMNVSLTSVVSPG